PFSGVPGGDTWNGSRRQTLPREGRRESARPTAFRIGDAMPTYKYEALDTSGAEVKDQIEATNEEEASQKIKAMGYFVTKLTAGVGGKGAKGKKKKTGKSRKTFTIGGVSNKMLVTFTRQFSTLQDAGLPVLRSLRILEKQMKPSVLKNSLIDVVEDVESGSALSEALGKHPKCFNRLYVNM